MAERRAAAKGRRMGSSRRKQLREGSGEAPAAAPGPGEELPWASEIVQRVQDFFRERDKDQTGFVTRSDMQKLQEEDLPCSAEELELVFDGLDAAGTGQLSTEEFTAGLWQFLSSQKAARDHRRRKTASRRVRLVVPSPVLEGVDSEERRQFAAFMDQLGTDNVSEEQEIWQLWVKLRQDEPQLLGNLEDFLAKMRHRIQEARSKKEALEVTLNKHVAEHDKEVQQLCEALEQQIQQEQQRLEQESMARSQQHSMELQQALDASEREVQRLVTAQMELETRCRSLRSMQQAASTENRQLEESNRVLEDRLEHLHQQLQQTHELLRTARASMAREHAEEPGDRAVAELPGKMSLSPQMSLEKSEKNHSEMQIRLGTQGTEPKAKSTHHVVWEILPAETSILGPPPRASSTEEDPFPEFLKEERFSDQSSLLTEMNDAIAALSKQLKPQAPGAPPAPADAARHPQDDAEPQTGLEAAAAHDTTPGILQETLPSHVGHELFEGDLKEGPATAELRAPDMTQAGASAGAGHCRAQEPGAEQGESSEEARRMLFLQGKGAGEKELMLKAVEHLQGAPGESVEAGEQALMEVEGEGWMQEKTGWEEAQVLGEAEEVALNQGENLEAGLGPPETGEGGLAAGWQLATDELGPAAAPEERAQPLGTGLGEEAELPSGLSEKLEIKPGERLEPKPPSGGEARMEAAQGDGVLPEVTEAPDPGMLEEERVDAEVQPWGETLDADVPPAPAQHGGSSRAGAEEGEVEVTQPREAEPRPQGESARGDAAWGGSTGAEGLLPPADVQEGGVGTDVQAPEAQSSDADVQLLAEVEELKASTEADLQPPSEAGSPGTEQGGSVAPGVQPLDQLDKPELGLGEEMGAAAVHGEGPSPAETPAGSLDLGGLFPVKAQALELVGAEESQADTQLRGGASAEAPRGGGDHAAVQLGEEAEDGGRGQGERELPREPVVALRGAGFGQGEEGAGVEEQAGAEGDERSAGRGDPAPLHLGPFGVQRPGAEVDGDVQHPEEEGERELAPGEGMNHDGLFPVKAQALELEESEDSWAGTQLRGGASPETPQGGEAGAAVQLGEEAEDGGRGQGECELPREPVVDLRGAGFGQGEEGAGADVQPREEAVILGTLEDRSPDANVQLLAEAEELQWTPGGSTEADLEPHSEAGSLDTEQGGSVAPDVQPLDLVDKPELVEMVEAEDLQADTQLRGGASPETPQGRGDRAARQLVEEAEDGAQGQDERGLSHEPVLHPHGVAIRQGEGAPEGVQPREEAEILDMVKGQSPDANVQLLAEAEELQLTPGGSTEADLEPHGEAGSLDTEQGGSMAPDVQLLDQVDKPELVEMVEAEDSWADTQLHGVASSETPQEWGDRAAVPLVEEAEDGAQGQGERELHHEHVLRPHGETLRQGEGAPEGVQPPEEAESLGTLEDQSPDANAQLLAETDELEWTPGGSTEADLQPPGTEQGGSVAPGVQPLDQLDKPELGLGEEMGAAAVHGEGPSPAETPVGSLDLGGLFPVKAQALELVGAEESQADTQLRGGASAEAPRGGGDHAAVQLGEEAEDGGRGQGERELPREPVVDLRGAGFGQGEEGAGADVQPREEAVILGTLEDRSPDANVQLLAEAEELQLTPGGSTEADLEPHGKAGSLDTEQGGSVAPDVQLLDQVDKPELVEMVEAEDLQADTQLRGGASPETPQGRGDRAARQLVEEAEDGAQGQDERGLSHEPVLHPHGVAIRQGEGAPEGVQPREEAEILDMVKGQSPDANVQLLAEAEELQLTPGGSTEADLEPHGKAGSLDTEQGGSVAPDVQLLDQVDKPELVEMVEAEDSWADTQLHGVASSETPREWGDRAAVPFVEEAEDGAQGQGERELHHEHVLRPHGETLRQGEGAPEGVQPPEEAESLGTLEDQSPDANAQLLAETDELEWTPGGSTEADLQPPGTEQGGSVAPGVQPLDQLDKPELGLGEEMGAAAVHGEGPSPAETPAGSLDLGGLFPVKAQALELVGAEESQADTQLRGGASAEAPRGGGDHAAVQLGEEAEDGGRGQGERELPREPVVALRGAGFGQGEEGAGVEEQAGAEGDERSAGRGDPAPLHLGLVGVQRPGAEVDGDVQHPEEEGERELAPGEGMNHDGLFPVKAQALELEESEDSWAGTQLRGGASPETPQGGEAGAAVQLGEEAEDGGRGQGERELPREPVVALRGAGFGQGEEGAGADVQPREEAVILGTLEDRSPDANVQLLAEAEELQWTPGGSTEADVAPLGAAGMREGEQSQAPGLDAGLCAAHTADVWEGAAGARVSPPAEAALHPEHAAAAGGPGLEAMLGALTGPDWQILEDAQTLEIAQGERADAEERALDGARGLEVVRGERLEAGARILVETQSLGIKQGHDDGASALAPPVSEVTLQIGTLKLETMMQEDVLVPDVWRLGASEQAAQSELQEQVSAQADKVRLHAASQQSEEKLPHVMETEQVAAGPAKPPKQEVPPASTLHTRVQQEEDAGNDQLGMVLRDSSLGDAANSSMQSQRQLLGEQNKDLSAGQQEEKQEVGWKMSQEGEPSSGEPGAVTADGAGAAPRGSPEASLDPDHLYNVLFVGDSHVGKTSFLYRLHADTFNPHLTATVGLDYQVKNLVVDNKRFAIRLWDSAGQERYHSITKQFFRKADGVVLMYDITSEYSFSNVRYWLSCIQEGAEDGVAILLLGNKTDCAAERQVPTKEGERLAKEHQLVFYECSAASGHNISESMVSLIRLLKVREDELKNKAEEVPKLPQKKKGCCW